MNDSANNKKLAIIWVAIIVVFFGSIVALAKFSGGSEKTDPAFDTTYSGVVPELAKLSATDHFRGGKDAKVVVMEYSDLECPYCKLYSGVMTNLHQTYGDKVTLVYRHFPLSLATGGRVHPHSMLAAQATEAASEQGKFWEMHDKIFEGQDNWRQKAAGDPLSDARNIFTGYAKELGLDVERFKKDLDSPDLRQRILAAYKSGDEAGVNSTPSFFVNGKKVAEPNGYEGLKKIIDEAMTTAGAQK